MEQALQLTQKQMLEVGSRVEQLEGSMQSVSVAHRRMDAAWQESIRGLEARLTEEIKRATATTKTNPSDMRSLIDLKHLVPPKVQNKIAEFKEWSEKTMNQLEIRHAGYRDAMQAAEASSGDVPRSYKPAWDDEGVASKKLYDYLLEVTTGESYNIVLRAKDHGLEGW